MVYRNQIILWKAFLLTIAMLYIISEDVMSQSKNIRDYGVELGVMSPGPINAITDVEGVQVGHTTLIEANSIRTGVTAVLPHDGNPFQQKVPGAVYVGNGFGKLAGSTQVEELGSIETPIILTNTLSVPTAADALIDYTLSFDSNSQVRSVNPLVGETNDGWLNDIQGRHVQKKHVMQAIESARAGNIEQGNVGAGTGTTALGFKGGIGTSSRQLPPDLGGYTVGVLVQTNFGGVLRIAGVPAGKELGVHYFKQELQKMDEGSCMIIVTTDAPILSRNLKRLAKRALLEIGRTGGIMSNGSGDYVIAFYTAQELRIPHHIESSTTKTDLLRNKETSPLFLAVVDATEEAILNSLFHAETITGRDGHTITSLPLEKVLPYLEKYSHIKK